MIDVTPMKKIQGLLDAAQKGCRARTLEVEEVGAAVAAAENRLSELGISKKAWIGCKVIMIPERVSNGYGARADGTQVILVRAATVWQVESVGRVQCGTCPYGSGRRNKLVLSVGAVEAMPKELYL